MFTIIWLLVWLFHDTPQLERWNSWLVALLICAAADFFGAGTTVKR